MVLHKKRLEWVPRLELVEIGRYKEDSETTLDIAEIQVRSL
jgi:hypothetical protein